MWPPSVSKTMARARPPAALTASAKARAW
jgi:hypothetical protein